MNKLSSTEEQTCWDTLNGSLDGITDEIEKKVNNDSMLLEAIADIIAEQELVDSPEIQQIIDGFKPNTMISHIALLLPGDKVMLPGESPRNTAGLLSYAEESAKGCHISDRSTDIRDNSRMILRNFVPVVKNGQTVAVLYGVVDLQTLPEQIKVSAYDKQAAVYLIDGTSGNFIMDTWHNTLGNLSDMGERKTKSGYSSEKLSNDVKAGNAGHCIFVSSTTGDNLYFCYEPVDINNWSVGISVSYDIAFARVKSINGMLIGFMTLEVILLAGYFLYILKSTKKELSEKKRLAERDLLTGLLNRNCFESRIVGYASECNNSLACIYIDVNGLHEINNSQGHAAGDKMLKTVAKAVQEAFADRDCYRIGGDEFVAFVCDGEAENIREKVDNVCKKTSASGYHISVGVCRRNIPVDIDELIKEAEKEMYENKRQYYNSKGSDRRARS